MHEALRLRAPAFRQPADWTSVQNTQNAPQNLFVLESSQRAKPKAFGFAAKRRQTTQSVLR